jgi:hypothetical protein
MLAITPTVDATTRAVRLTITGGTPDYVVTAEPGGGRAPYTVRSTFAGMPGDGSARIAVDGGVPLNVPTTYRATDRDGRQAWSSSVLVPSSSSVLSDALDPSRVLDVAVVSQPPNSYAARSVWWDVLGGVAPFASLAPMRLRAGDLVLYTATPATRYALRTLLLTGNPLVLRTACPDAVDDVTMLVSEGVESLALDDAPAGGRLWTLTYQALSAEQLGPYVLDPARTYAQLPLEHDTYAATLAAFATYAALRTGTAPARAGE